MFFPYFSQPRGILFFLSVQVVLFNEFLAVIYHLLIGLVVLLFLAFFYQILNILKSVILIEASNLFMGEVMRNLFLCIPLVAVYMEEVLMRASTKA